MVSEPVEQFEELLVDPVTGVVSTLSGVQVGDAANTDGYPEESTVLPTPSARGRPMRRGAGQNTTWKSMSIYQNFVALMLHVGAAFTCQQADVDVASLMSHSNVLPVTEQQRRNPTWGQAMKSADKDNWVKADEVERAQHVARDTFQEIHVGHNDTFDWESGTIFKFKYVKLVNFSNKIVTKITCSM